MRTLRHFLVFLLLPLAVFGQQQPQEIIVTGRQPGPPLWRVTNGERVLWIFPYLSPVPEGMIWETGKIAGVLAQTQEVLEAPDADLSASPLVLLNPVSMFRGWRLAKRLSGNPDDATLASVLPEDLYKRFAALKERYFPRDTELEALRPALAGSRLLRRVQREEGLVSGETIQRELERLIRRQRGIRRTEIELDMRVDGSYRELAARAEAMAQSLSREQELACFEGQLGRAERDIEDMKFRANAWAQGYIDEFRMIPLAGDDDDACRNLILGSSELAAYLEMQNRLADLWLANAERALRENDVSFAILRINELILPNGLLARLRAKGYEVREP